MHNSLINEFLLELRSAFVKSGFDLRFVGGCVRDLLSGVTPSDIDLCTNANPKEQLAVYVAFGFKYLETGAQHGTYTVISDAVGYEITSLRTETNHDGRYATMDFTRDWLEDLSRRDFTINAMSLTFSGELIDPFGGEVDLANKVLRFVGDASERMQEDYLRIMRYFRFLGRLNDPNNIDTITSNQLKECVSGLSGISVERIWCEMKKIIQHDSACWIIPFMQKCGVFAHTQLPTPSFDGVAHAIMQKAYFSDVNPVIIMLSFVCTVFDDTTKNKVNDLAKSLKWSNSERAVAMEIANMGNNPKLLDLKRAMAIHGKSRTHMIQVCQYWLMSSEAEEIKSYEVIAFPIDGEYLIAHGIKPGRELGIMISKLKECWFDTGCMYDADTLMAMQ